MSADRKAWAELPERISATVKPIPARALLLWLMAKRPAAVSTFDPRRVAMASVGFSIVSDRVTMLSERVSPPALRTRASHVVVLHDIAVKIQVAERPA